VGKREHEFTWQLEGNDRDDNGERTFRTSVLEHIDVYEEDMGNFIFDISPTRESQVLEALRGHCERVAAGDICVSPISPSELYEWNSVCSAPVRLACERQREKMAGDRCKLADCAYEVLHTSGGGDGWEDGGDVDCSNGSNSVCAMWRMLGALEDEHAGDIQRAFVPTTITC